jgi:ABC-type multidrug transport system fused ATPase/permease subunit
MKKQFYLVLYFIAVVALFIGTGFRLRLPHLILLLFPLAFFEKQPKHFLLQWFPFFSIVFVYDSFRSIADNLGGHVNYDLLPLIERKLFFGTLPTIELQKALGGHLRGELGIVLSVFYFGHFVMPIILLYLLWQKDIWAFRKLCFTLALVSLMGFFTFALFPAAPPWLAAQTRFIPPVDHTILFFLKKVRANLPAVYFHMNPNRVAPFPSLHAAYPLILYLCSRKNFPKLSYFLMLNLILVCFAIVLFGEHYVVDLFGGWAYAILSYRSVDLIIRHWKKTSLAAGIAKYG